MKKVYRIVAAAEVTGGEEGVVRARVPAQAPEHPTCHEGEWACLHSCCPVRLVSLRIKFHHHLRLPRLRCPLCLRTLEFHQWLAPVFLTEVPERGVAVAADGSGGPRLFRP